MLGLFSNDRTCIGIFLQQESYGVRSEESSS